MTRVSTGSSLPSSRGDRASTTTTTKAKTNTKTKTTDKRETKTKLTHSLRRGGRGPTDTTTTATATAIVADSLSDPREFWDSLEDHEFFGDRVTHLYFYEVVNDMSVQQVRSSILEACKSVRSPDGVWRSPKPVLIHVNSPGGSMFSENWLFALFNQVQVPICVMVDGMSASAATALSVMAPYRVAASTFALTLIHDYAGFTYGTREDMLATTDHFERARQRYRNMYLRHTRIKPEELERLLRRDIWLDADTCKRYGIYDRVLFEKASSRRASRLPFAEAAFIKRNWNTLYLKCNVSTPIQIDAILAEGRSSEVKPIVLVSPGEAECEDIYSSLAIIPRLLACRAAGSPPVYGIVDNELSWWQLLPILFCSRRYMYETAALRSDMAYFKEWGRRLADIVHNTDVLRKILHRAVVENNGSKSGGHSGSIPRLLVDLFDRTTYVDASRCRHLGLVDQVVPLRISSPPEKEKKRGSSRVVDGGDE